MRLATDERSSEERAYDEGVEDAGIKADIKEIQRHQAEINGSVGRTATGLEKVSDCLDEILGRLDKRDTIEGEREKQRLSAEAAAKKAREESVTNRTFKLGAVAVCVTILLAIGPFALRALGVVG